MLMVVPSDTNDTKEGVIIQFSSHHLVVFSFSLHVQVSMWSRCWFVLRLPNAPYEYSYNSNRTIGLNIRDGEIRCCCGIFPIDFSKTTPIRE